MPYLFPGARGAEKEEGWAVVVPVVLLGTEAVGTGVEGGMEAEGTEAGWGGMAATEVGVVMGVGGEGAGMDTGTVAIIDPDGAVAATGEVLCVHPKTLS